ncbi:protein translocase subunit SecDF [Opitutus terrae]|uniref:Multifunctional fusion protein n=1 Tax=Opitutus terrae (strain DSM 11246 / JCM 15787 / PB90-1) TaxID=452637 RepID=B1ZV74_OPITP|nr:protein translocase subunit SecDF [Opitutus terrae]ACB76741.1 protein-export membrane protein SecD [Opitutus terrae PB90-1]
MFRRNLWKLLLTLAMLGWAIATLIPLQDQPFVDYVKAHVTAKPAEFNALLAEASAMKREGRVLSEFVALKQIGKDRRLDLTQYFPDIRIESNLTNVEKRNEILLAELLRRSKSRLPLGLDLAGGVAFTLEAVQRPGDTADERERAEKLDKAIEIISTRINAFGVAEPLIRKVGNNRIEVQLPGVNTRDNPEIVDQVKAPARLDFRIVHPTLTPAPGVETPPGYEIMSLDYEGRRGETGSEELFIKRVPEMTGEAISNSFARPDMYGKPEVILQFTNEGKQRFAEVTRQIAEGGRQAGRLGRLAIVLDNKLYSAPTVREEINSESAQITGSFTDREALNLANVLNNPLDVELQVKEQYEVGPTMAESAVESGKRATYIGVGLVAVFMIGYYTIAGFVAVLSVTLNILVVLGVLASLGATLTMPGIAGIVLTVGMAVDAHILIFERMREELSAGKSLVAAFHSGHDRAFTTIVDANLTTLITSVLMIVFGNGPVKGFGVTITIGIFSTLFTALLVSQMLLDFLISSGRMKKMLMMSFLQPPAIDFVKYGKRAFIASWIVVAIGLSAIAFRGSSIYGIDFAGGDVINLAFKQEVNIEQVQRTLDNAKLGETLPFYQSEIGGGQRLLNLQTEAGKGQAAVATLKSAYPNAGFEVAGSTIVGPSMGREIQLNALLSIGLSILGIMLYVAFRFEIGYGIGAVVSTIHDVLLTIGIFVLSGRQFSAPMVGAILLIVGYSINDTIVVFDRIREELKNNPNTNLRDVINLATSRVFARSILTSLTTFLAALALYLFGGGVVNDLSFTFLVGIVTGTFSSLFIATPIFYWWHKGDRKHVEAHHDIAPKYEWTGSSKASH